MVILGFVYSGIVFDIYWLDARSSWWISVFLCCGGAVGGLWAVQVCCGLDPQVSGSRC